jgi:hypothetical protein
MRGHRPSSRSLQTRELRKLTLLVHEDCAEGLRQFAHELRARRSDGPAYVSPTWRRLSASVYLMISPEYHTRCAIRDTGAGGPNRFHWVITVLGQVQPVAEGRTGEFARARSLAEAALSAYAADLAQLHR